MDYSDFFKEYEALVGQVEKAFETVKSQFPDQVKCKSGCSDCCYAIFDVTLIEAMYINYHFVETMSGKLRQELVEKSNKTDRLIHRMKKEAVSKLKKGEDESKVIDMISSERIRCPMLSENDTCEIYSFRPIACRVYGIPTAMAGEAHICGIAGFEKGEQYPTLNMDAVYTKLYGISHKLVKHINSKYKSLGTLLVPLSLVIINDYNEDYLGIDV